MLAALPMAASAQSRDLDTFVLFALKEFRTKGLTVQSGNLGVNQPGGFLSASSHGIINAPQSQVVADMTRMSTRSSCLHLYANSHREACGPSSLLDPLPVVADPLAACGFPAVFPDCNTAPDSARFVPNGSTLTLAPGVYGNVRVFGGGRLVLSGGDYKFCSLRAALNSEVVFQHASTVYVKNNVNIGNSTFTGPEPGAPITAADVRFFVNGPLVHFSGNADVHARVCAPNAWLRLTHGANLEGNFVASTVRTERITVGLPGGGPGATTTTTTTTASPSSTSTSSPASTTTTLPDCAGLCGNGHIDPACNEECDGEDFGTAVCPNSSVAGAFLRCEEDCTIDRGECPCGNGIVDPSEGCDPAATPTGCAAGQHCGQAEPGFAEACWCVNDGSNPPAAPQEICGNCIDDDHNGDTDFEDGACCPQQQTFAMSVRRGRLRPRGSATKLRLRSVLARSGLENVNPRQQDVFLQIRPNGGSGDILCAQVPAAKFMRMHGAFKFWDRKHLVASAKGLDDMSVKVKKNKSVRLRTVGRRVQFQMPSHGLLQVTVGFHDPTNEAQNRCSTQVQAFRTTRSGRLIAP